VIGHKDRKDEGSDQGPRGNGTQVGRYGINVCDGIRREKWLGNSVEQVDKKESASEQYEDEEPARAVD
jgi:hypothetical protein